MTPSAGEAVPSVRPGAWRVGLVLLKVGVLAFGGPAAHVALMRREVVGRRGWLDERSFLRMFAACNLIPGPSSTELAMFLGYRLAGRAGLVLAGGLFIAPAMLIMLGIAWLYARYGTAAPAVAVLDGVRPVVVGIVAWALVDLGRRVVRRPPALALGAGVALASLLGGNPVLLLAVGGAVQLAVERTSAWRRRRAAGWLPLLGWPGLTVVAHGERLPVLFLTFLKLGAVSFGSGYVLFALLQADFVDGLHWLSRQQLVDAIAVGQVTPGPVFTTATFLGYLFAGGAGALLATAAIFLPGFVLVPFLDRIVRLVDQRAAVLPFLDGVNVAVIGLIAAVLVQLAGASVHHVGAAILAAGTLLVLLRQPLASPALVAVGVAAGWLLGPAI